MEVISVTQFLLVNKINKSKFSSYKTLRKDFTKCLINDFYSTIVGDARAARH